VGLELQGNRTGSNQTVGRISFVNNTNEIVRINADSAAGGSTGNLTFTTSGTERLRITSGGLIGIQVTPTQQRLTIDVFNTGTTAASYDGINICNTSSTTNNGSAIVFGQAVAGNSYARIGVINSDRSGGSEDQDIFFGTLGGGSYAERLRITSAGKIGVNNSAPLYSMHFKNAMASSPSYIHMEVTGTNTVGGGGGIAFDTSASNSASNNSLYLATIAGIRNSSNDGSNDLVFSTSKADVNSNLPAEKLRITSAGRVHVTDGDFKVTDGNSGLLFEESNNGAYLWLDGANGDFSGGDYYGIAANNSAKLQFGYAGAADLVLDSAGIVTKPKHPAFRVFRNQSNWNVAGSTKFDFDSVVFNTGSHYSTSTDRFTVPVTGVYQFNFSIILYGSNLTSEWVSLRVNNSRVTGGDLHFSIDYSNNRWHNVSYSHTMYLSANDYVEMWNGGGSVDYHGDNWAQFSGHLVG